MALLPLHQIPIEGYVPEWTPVCDGDGLLAIQHCTPENDHLESRFMPEETRRYGYTFFWEIQAMDTFATFEEAHQALNAFAQSGEWYI